MILSECIIFKGKKKKKKYPKPHHLNIFPLHHKNKKERQIFQVLPFSLLCEALAEPNAQLFHIFSTFPNGVPF